MSQPLLLSVCNPWLELWMKRALASHLSFQAPSHPIRRFKSIVNVSAATLPAFSMPPTSDVTCLPYLYRPMPSWSDVSVGCIVGVVVL
ncbi:hypothetical protein FB45DRAFT_1043155 [Roridomyces roridus]|uniref:Uncharacterized protein n=1 Tax=Roridomyces roridus TaxID=1738132 RepID=A0AAD7F997_9AGAR|nr:hypothetical protein FB45DRAFT_1043155 [Roridomyces roridus]